MEWAAHTAILLKELLRIIYFLVRLQGFPQIPLIKYARVAQWVEHVHITQREMQISRTAILLILAL